MSLKPLFKKIALTLSSLLIYQSVALPLAEASLFSTRSNFTPKASSLFDDPSVSGSQLPKHVRSKKSIQFSIPAPVGEIVDSYAPKKAGRMVYHIQDVHNHVPSQTNLSEIINQLSFYASAQNKKVLVAIEGVEGEIDSDALSAYPDKNIKIDVSDALLRAGLLFGEEHSAINHEPGQIKIVGVETQSLYEKNDVAEKVSDRSRKEISKIISEIRFQLEKLKPHNFNNVLAQLEKNRLAVEDGRLGVTEYVQFLNKVNAAEVKKYKGVSRILALAETESKIDFEALEKETQKLLSDLMEKKSEEFVEKLLEEAQALKAGELSPLSYYRGLLMKATKVSPLLESYVSYLKESEKADVDALFDEILELETKIAINLFKHPLAKQLYAHLRWVERQEKFFSLEMIPQEWTRQQDTTLDEILARRSQISDFVAEQTSDIGYQFVVPNFPQKDLALAVKGARAYYRVAKARDLALTKNLKSLMQKYPGNDYVVALIAGGFHTPGITKQLEKNGYAYSVVRPQIETEIELSDNVDIEPIPDLEGEYARANVGTNKRLIGGIPRFGRRIGSLFAQATRLRSSADQLEEPVILPFSVPEEKDPNPPTKPATNKPFYPEWISTASSPVWVGVVVLGITFLAPGENSELSLLGMSVPQLFGALVILGAGIVIGYLLRSYKDNLRKRVEEAAKKLRSRVGKELSDEEFQILRSYDAQYQLNPWDMFYLASVLRQMRFPEEGSKSIKLPTPPSSVGKSGGATFSRAQLFDQKRMNGNFVPNSWMTEEDEKEFLGGLDFEEDMLRENAEANRAEAQRTTVLSASMDGGRGLNFQRQGALSRDVVNAVGGIVPHIPGAKATDLKFDVELDNIDISGNRKRKDVEVSLAEVKILNLLLKAGGVNSESIGMEKQPAAFDKVQFQPLTNPESAAYYYLLLDQVFLGDKLDDRIVSQNKRTYRQIFREVGLEILDFHNQPDLPMIDQDTLELPSDDFDLIPKQVGGHAQLGFGFLFQALEKAQKGIKTNSVLFFSNGDNVNSQPPPEIVGHLKRTGDAVYMLTTPAEKTDVKGGKIGVRIEFDADGKPTIVPDIMELAQAQDAQQLDPFVKTGQQDGIGRVGKQRFNTNGIAINIDVVGSILVDVVEAIRSETGITDEARLLYELSKIISPTRIPKKKVDEKTGKTFLTVDGAISSVMLNLNGYLTTTTTGKQILKKHNLDRLLRFVNVPRDQFTPNKFPSDHWAYSRWSRFNLNSKLWTLEDKKKGMPQVEVEFRVNPNAPPTGKWNIDAGQLAWADLAYLDSAFGDNPQTDNLAKITVHGNFFFMENPDLQGRIKFVNEAEGLQPNVVNLNDQIYDDVFDASPLADTIDGKRVLRNALVHIHKDNSVSIHPEDHEVTFSVSAYKVSYQQGYGLIAGLLAAGFLFFFNDADAIVRAIVAFTGFSGILLSVLGTASTSISNVQIDINDPGQSLESLRGQVNPFLLILAEILAILVGFLPGVKKVVVTQDGIGAAKDGTIYIGIGLLTQPTNFVSLVVKVLLLPAVVFHEASHVVLRQTRSTFLTELTSTVASVFALSLTPLFLLVAAGSYAVDLLVFPRVMEPAYNSPGYTGRAVQTQVAQQSNNRRFNLSKLKEILLQVPRSERFHGPNVQSVFADAYIRTFGEQAGLDRVLKVVTPFNATRAEVVNPQAAIPLLTTAQPGSKTYQALETTINEARLVGVNLYVETVEVTDDGVVDVQSAFTNNETISSMINDDGTNLYVHVPVEDPTNPLGYQYAGVNEDNVVPYGDPQRLGLQLFVYSHYTAAEAVLKALVQTLQRLIPAMKKDRNISNEVLEKMINAIHA